MDKYKEKIKKWCQEESNIDENLFVKRLKDKKISNAAIEAVLDVIDATCLHCFNDNKSCRCWSDR